MDYTTAHKIMAEIHLRRDWTLVWHRITDELMLVEIKGIVDNSSSYPRYDRKSIHTTEFYIHLRNMHTAMDVLNLVMRKLIDSATHEEREFMRVGPSWTAPFHPHTELGNRNWMQIQAALIPA